MCVQARGHCLVSFSVTLFFETESLTDLEPAYLARVSGQPATGIVLSLPP